MKLRALEPEDLEWIYEVENDTTIWDCTSTNVPYSRQVLSDFILNTTGDIYTDKQVRMILEDDSERPVGIVDLVNFTPHHLRAEVGIVIRQELRQHGYGHQALHLLEDYCRDILHLHQLYAVICVQNKSSVALFEKAGFVASAVLHGWLFSSTGYQDAVLMQYFL